MNQGFDKDYFYNGPEDFITKNGIELFPSELTEIELNHVIKVFEKSKQNKNRECFYNAQLLTLLDKTNQIEYWEGYTNFSSIPILHGFNVLNNKVIDVTHKINKKPILGLFTEKEYIGVRFNKELIQSRIMEGKDSISFIDNFQEGWPVLREKWVV
jgi:hypothetical protein